jgi:hypothetical protein
VKDSLKLMWSMMKKGTRIKIWKDRSIYVGELKESKKHGKGLFIEADGTKYEGEFKNDKRDGQGTMV